jgi:4-amino-4-deoxy-L-arabinose transferase-like glycosyltransferase
MFSKSSLFFLILLLTAFATRFIGLSWGNGYYFHPDESNMAISLSQLTSSNLNPHFFAYGQFPLYLGYFTLQAFNLPNNFANSIFILRFWSAIFSVLAVFVIYLIFSKLFSRPQTLIMVLLVIFNPGLIQLAHFGTTESLLILIFLINIYLAIKIVDHPEIFLSYILAGAVTGIGLAAKISSLIFLGPILLASFISFIKSHHRLTYIPKLFLLLIFTLISGIIFSPYNILAKSDFLSSLNYETNVATGLLKVFYTAQFQKTIPYLFQFTHIFPYVSGIPIFILAILGFFIFIKNWKLEIGNWKYWSLILIPALVYFLYFGQLYVKWTRFVSPVFFIFPLFTAYFLSKIKNTFIRYFLLIICCLPGLYFLNLYFHPDIRLTASSWMSSHLPANSKIFSEAGNVINLPLSGPSYQIINYDFYGNYDPKTLISALVNADYILVPSRRVFKNYNFSYYRHLFDGSLGFVEIKQFNPQTDLFLNPENAEETWSVFDRPTIRIYQKIKQLDVSQYEKILQN